MKLEQQCCSFELAKKLKELGIVQGGEFYWCSLSGLDGEDEAFLWDVHEMAKGNCDRTHCAFTVAELGELLPPGYHSWWRVHAKENRKWTCRRDDDYEDADTEADARAKMVIYLMKWKRWLCGKVGT